MNLPPYVIAIPEERCLIVLKNKHETFGPRYTFEYHMV